MAIPDVLAFEDRAISGARPDREGLERLLLGAESGAFKTLYVESLSRLARDCVHSMMTLKRLVHIHGVRVVSVDDGVDTNLDGWELISAIFGVQNEQYLRSLSKQVHRGQVGIVKDGLCVGDTAYGYTSVPVSNGPNPSRSAIRRPKMEYAIHPEQAEWVRTIFHWYVEQRWPLARIVRELSWAEAPKSSKSKRKLWQVSAVTRILANSKYIGVWPWGRLRNVRDPIVGKTRQVPRPDCETEDWTRTFPHLRIINDATFQKAQQRLAESREHYLSFRKQDGKLRGSSSAAQAGGPRRFLSGWVVCGTCGRGLVITNFKSAYMSCPNYRTGGCNCMTTLPRVLAEKMIATTIVETVLADSDLRTQLLERAIEEYSKMTSDGPSKLQAIAKRIAEIETKTERLIDLCEREKVPEIVGRLTKLRSEKADLERQSQELRSSLNRAGDPPTVAWIEKKIDELSSSLAAAGSEGAWALRSVVPGRITVREVRRPGAKRHYLRAVFDIVMDPASIRAGHAVVPSAEGISPIVKHVEFDVRIPPPKESLGDQAKQLFDEGLTVRQIAAKLGRSRCLARKALTNGFKNFGQEDQNLAKIRRRLAQPRLHERIMDSVMELYRQDVPLREIADRLDCDRTIVQRSVQLWHAQNNMRLVDGRTRRLHIRLRKESKEINEESVADSMESAGPLGPFIPE